MNFVKLDYDLLNKRAGVIASESMTEGYPYHSSNSVYNLPLEGKINFVPNFDSIQISKKIESLVDLIYCVPVPSRGIIISEKLWNIIKNKNLGKSQIFDVKIMFQGKSYRYYFLYGYDSNYDEMIDFKEMKFFKKSMSMDYTIDLNISCYENLREEIDNCFPDEKVKYDKLILKNRNIDLDIFWLPSPIGSYYISLDLKEELISNRITGVKFL